MTRSELIAIIARLYTGEDNDRQATKLVRLLVGEFPNAKISDLIFHDSRDLTPEQVADEAIRIETEHAKLNSKQ